MLTASQNSNIMNQKYARQTNCYTCRFEVGVEKIIPCDHEHHQPGQVMLKETSGTDFSIHNSQPVLCLNFGTPENNELSIWDKWKIYYFRFSNT